MLTILTEWSEIIIWKTLWNFQKQVYAMKTEKILFHDVRVREKRDIV